MPTAPARTPSRRTRKPAAEAVRPSLTRENWIEAATEVLVDHGIDHVRIDVLARQLKVTRGSFYWHFRDREELLGSVLRTWHESATQQLTLRLGQAHAEVREQLRSVLSLPFRGRAAARAARIELAIRAWARRDLQARHAVDESDASRIGYIAQLFSALGFSVVEARARAFLLYSYNIGESVMAAQGNAAQRADRCQAIERLLLEGAPR
jgi:AcrR family transcriptional regulator